MKLSVLNFVAICCAVLFSIGASAQLEFPEDKVSWKFTVEQKGGRSLNNWNDYHGGALA